MATEERYFADANEFEHEKRRLQLLEEFLDPLAQPALLKAGVGPGSRVLEIGPGAGSMLRWLSDIVGTEGHVTAIDINPRFVEDIDLPNVTILKADLLDPPADLGDFDIVYARYVILHLPDTDAAAKALLNLVKPGGKAVIIDIDWRTMRAADPEHPLAASFDDQMELATEVLRDAGIMKLNFGPRGALALERAGFADVTYGGVTRLLKSGTHEVQWYRESVAPANAAVKAFAPDRAMELSEVLIAFDDPTFAFSSPVEAVATGTRPRG